MKLLLWLGAIAAGGWLAMRLWPALRTEPATWLGDSVEGGGQRETDNRLPTEA